MMKEERKYDIIEVRAGVEAENDRHAALVRRKCRESGVFLVNLMASPGAGKTSVLCRTVDELKKKYTVGVIEADMDADVDADTVTKHGARAVQLRTGNSCHMDGSMTMTGLDAFKDALPQIVFIENIGNLVCPAEFDVGADLNMMILSVPEGDDKPLKYPLMFSVAQCLLVNKIDTSAVFDFDLARFEKNLRAHNAGAPVFPVSAKTGEGMEPWFAWLEARIGEKFKKKG